LLGCISAQSRFVENEPGCLYGVTGIEEPPVKMIDDGAVAVERGDDAAVLAVDAMFHPEWNYVV